MAAQFVRFGLITLVSDKHKNNDSAITVYARSPISLNTVRGSVPPASSIEVSFTRRTPFDSPLHVFPAKR